MDNLEKMKRTVPLATTPKTPMTETTRPMTRKALGGNFSIIISCSLVQKGSPSSVSNTDRLRSMPTRLVPAPSTRTSSPTLKFIDVDNPSSRTVHLTTVKLRRLPTQQQQQQNQSIATNENHQDNVVPKELDTTVTNSSRRPTDVGSLDCYISNEE